MVVEEADDDDSCDEGVSSDDSSSGESDDSYDDEEQIEIVTESPLWKRNIAERATQSFLNRRDENVTFKR